jgi:hypothetical protein
LWLPNIRVGAKYSTLDFDREFRDTVLMFSNVAERTPWRVAANDFIVCAGSA